MSANLTAIELKELRDSIKDMVMRNADSLFELRSLAMGAAKLLEEIEADTDEACAAMRLLNSLIINAEKYYRNTELDVIRFNASLGESGVSHA